MNTRIIEKKLIIWSSEIDLSYWSDFIVEECTDMDENEVYQYISEINWEYLEDERRNLDIVLDHTIIAIADMGLWNGRVQGYRTIDSCNIKDLLDLKSYDDGEFYSDGKDVRSNLYHHDSVHHMLYREIRDESKLDDFTNWIYSGRELTRQQIGYYTRSIAPHVAKVYGW